MIEFQLLGCLDIRGPDISSNARVRRRHPMALLALVAAAAPQAVGRDRIMAFLWPDSDADRASNSVRQTLFRLRRDLGENLFLPETANGIQLDAANLQVDLWAFRAAIARKAPEEAVALYRGPFLDGFHIPGAHEFSTWVDAERERLERQHIAALDAVARQAGEDGRYDDAVAWRRRHAAADPFSSRTALGLLRALTAAGDRPGALEHATAHESLVRLHLEVEPDPTVTEFVASIKNGPAIGKRERSDTAPRAVGKADGRANGTATATLAMDEEAPPVSVSGGTSRPRARDARSKVSRWPWLVASVFVVFGIVGAGSKMGGRIPTPPAETFVVVASGLASAGGRDTATLLISCDGVACPSDQLPQHPFVIPAQSSYTSPATGTSFIVQVPDGTTSAPPGYKCCTTAVFENKFKLPSNALSSTISITVLADNQATVAINGVEFGRQADRYASSNFGGAPTTFTTTFAPDPSGINRLHVTLWDGGGALGLNYRAFITWEAAREPKSLAPDRN